MTGHIRRRGKNSWELKFDVGKSPNTGKRQIRFASFKGTKRKAELELVKLIALATKGESVDPSKITVAEYVRTWLEGSDLSPKTVERYKQLAEQQIIPHLGATLLQKLRPGQIQEWHGTLAQGGGKGGKPLSARTVGHAHRVLHRALARAAAAEVVSRNVASVIALPKVETVEIEILSAAQMGEVLTKLQAHPRFPIVALALGSGMRRGEILALQWGDVDLDAGSVRVERSLEETAAGLRMKKPKTRHGRRTISLPPSAVDPLRAHRRKQLETRLALGQGRESADALVFSTPDGEPLSPDNLSRDWRRLVKVYGLPSVSFHALRHSHASALIASSLDVLTVSRRLGHSSPVVTLTVYAHLFEKTDTVAASAIEAAMQGGRRGD